MKKEILDAFYQDYVENAIAPPDMLDLYDAMIGACVEYADLRQDVAFEAGFKAGFNYAKGLVTVPAPIV